MIKVLMLGNHPSNKGGMTSVINQIRSHNWEQDGVKLSFVPTFIPGDFIKKSFFYFCALLRILCIFVVSKPDIVYMHMSYKGSFTRKYIVHKFCKIFGIKDIIHLHGSEFEKWYSSVDRIKQGKIRKLLLESDEFIVLGNEWKRIIQQIEPLAKITIINNGIKIPSFTAKWNDEKCQVLFLGVLIPRKGVSDLIQAAKLIKRSGKIQNIEFVFAGIGEDEDKLKEQVKEANLEKFISFIGWVSGEKKEELFLHKQIFALPSYNEGLPVSILEAASYGLPIVSTNVGDISSVVKDGINGYLIKPGDIQALSERILSLSDQQLWEKFSYESRKIAKEKFNIDLFYSKLLEVWKNTVA